MAYLRDNKCSHHRTLLNSSLITCQEERVKMLGDPNATSKDCQRPGIMSIKHISGSNLLSPLTWRYRKISLAECYTHWQLTDLVVDGNKNWVRHEKIYLVGGSVQPDFHSSSLFLEYPHDDIINPESLCLVCDLPYFILSLVWFQLVHLLKSSSVQVNSSEGSRSLSTAIPLLLPAKLPSTSIPPFTIHTLTHPLSYPVIHYFNHSEIYKHSTIH